MNRKKALQALGIFFLIMCFLTVFSRSMDSFRVAQVTTGTIQKTMIDHSVGGSGNVESTNQQAVFTVAQMKISSMAVQEGDQVKEGDSLFQVDLKTLQERKSAIKAEIEQARLTQEDARKQNQIAQEKQEAALTHAQENYNQAVAAGDLAVAQAQSDLNLANERLNEFYASSDDGLNSEEGQSSAQDEQSLLDDVREKEKALESALASRDQSVATARQAVEDASFPAQTDSSDQIQEVTISQKQTDLDEVNTLLEQGGKVIAANSGVVSKINVSTGGQTTDEAVLLLGQKSENYQVVASVDASMEEYINLEAEVVFTDRDGKKLEKSGEVKSVKNQEENSSMLSVVLSVPSQEVEIGDSLNFEITNESEVYDCCLPLTALYEDDSDYFVYVVEEEDSVLGTIQTVRQVPVEVEDKNETMAALKSGVLTDEQQVVVDSDRTIQGGSRVRLKDS